MRLRCPRDLQECEMLCLHWVSARAATAVGGVPKPACSLPSLLRRTLRPASSPAETSHSGTIDPVIRRKLLTQEEPAIQHIHLSASCRGDARGSKCLGVSEKASLSSAKPYAND